MSLPGGAPGVPRRGEWRFVFQRRWLVYIACAIVFAFACVLLSNWQQARGREAQAENDLVGRNWTAAPVPLADAVPSLGAWNPQTEWEQVTVTGRYLAAEQYFVRNRATDNGPGLEVLVPLQTDSGVFVVDRGWVPSPNHGGFPASVDAAPGGSVTVTVRLRQSEPTLPGQSAQGRSIGTINLPQLAGLLQGAGVSSAYTGAYGLLVSEDPAPRPSASAEHLTPVVADPPYADTGMHWSYMIQWLIFAVIGFFGLGYAIRLEYRRRREGDPEIVAQDAARAARQRIRYAASDAAVEDSIVDSSTGRRGT
ncbi:SURF1 family protein [Gryllotalpicola sp.]|uniref:SURF1 family cytochrome oxidase biogenesis protein n=1 Tax=Gryllotalpicola sp. TaxID=1932787 RepID=UPI00261C0BEF|nr:SURF1 family protein [Gryllotalpicola sp.]